MRRVVPHLGRGRERVQVAILKVSVGDVNRLMTAVAAAKRDYRDVLWWAEYPEPDRPRQGPPEDTGALLDWVTGQMQQSRNTGQR